MIRGQYQHTYLFEYQGKPPSTKKIILFQAAENSFWPIRLFYQKPFDAGAGFTFLKVGK